MIQSLLFNLIQIIIGFSGGLAVGAGFVAFLTVLGIIPRLIQLSKSEKLLKVYIGCVIFGILFGTYLSFTNITWEQPMILLAFWGLLHGIFNGMLAAALTEVLNVFPILNKRLGIDQHILWLLMAIVFGKIAGSIFQWTIFVK
ncbi:stage V sporulation protein AB [Virgibacillus profundi]|uniref:Stage V sporulation protein AB n=1 Tax=Virgibacillus profundi TaxID=2024555 RepID=A0A2A2ID38_9BACI|nr:stage V sporulation protein AB [Virgibacillus profundi]PAV29547.1 stage V sporulation protein AB [Virgibacillus profundi]PXY53717.1 stage V sporulation protein AB [Virgibacillus profundi]